MDNRLLFPIGVSRSCQYACGFLERSGCRLTDHPSPEITHLLLDIPGFPDDKDLKELLRMLPKTITVIGGNLNGDQLKDYRKMDLLKDSCFAAKNARITAECALRAAAPYLTATFADSPALILGWGRIGKCLAGLLSTVGCPVTVAARKESDRAMLEALGFRAVDFSGIEKQLLHHRVLFNSVPEGITLDNKSDHCVKIDLASAPGLQGSNVITARGLPGKYAPESAGKLIAETIIRLNKEEVT